MAVKRFLKMGMGTISREWGGDGVVCSSPCQSLLHTKGRYVSMLPMAGRTAGPIKTELGIGTHVDPRSVLVKVKVIYLCVRYNRIHDSDTWRTTMKHARSTTSSSQLVNANKTPDRSPQRPREFKRDKSPSGGQILIH